MVGVGVGVGVCVGVVVGGIIGQGFEVKQVGQSTINVV